MDPFTSHTGIAVPLNRSNVDTDAVIPKQFLKSIKRTGFGSHLFHQWRYVNGNPRQVNHDFILNHPKLAKASVLVAGDNFGCGSSREHAPWALRQYGFRVVISTGFADIFYNNCIKNSLLPAIVDESSHQRLMQEIENDLGMKIKVDLKEQSIASTSGLSVPFSISDDNKITLLEGLDDIARTLEHRPTIRYFEEKRQINQPWM